MPRHPLLPFTTAAQVLLFLVLAPCSRAAEGPALPTGALARIGSLRLRHPGPAICVAFAPDGKTFASVAETPRGSKDTDRLVILWEAATGKPVRQFRGHTESVLGVAFSPDGQLLVTGSKDRTLRLWEVATGKEVRRFLGHTDGVFPVAFAADGKIVASEGQDATVRLWDVATGKEVRQLPGHKSNGTSNLVFSPDGKLLASVGADFAVRLWDVATGQEVRKFVGHTKDCQSLDFSRDGKFLATIGEDVTMRLWDVASGKEVRRFAGLTEVGVTVRVAPDGTTLAGGTMRGSILFWELATGKLRATATGHLGIVSELSFSPDSKMLASAGHDGTVRLWDVSTGRELPQSGSSIAVRAALTSDGKLLATAGSERTVRFWGPSSGKELLPALGTAAPVRMLAFSPDGRILATNGAAGRIILWDVASRKRLRELVGDLPVPARLGFSPDGRWLVAVGVGTIRIWDAVTGRPPPGFAHAATAGARNVTPNGLAFSSDGMHLAMTGVAGQVHVWDIPAGAEVAAFPAEPRAGKACTALAFSPDGRTLATAAEDRSVQLWETASGKERRSPFRLPATPLALAFTVDGRALVVGSDDGVVRLWDVAGGKEAARRQGHEGPVTFVACSADGRHLASAGVDPVRSSAAQIPDALRGDNTAVTWDLTALRKALTNTLSKPTAADVETLWTDLASTDAGKAYDAIQRLASAPELAVSLLKERLPKANSVDAGPNVDRFLADLDHDDFDVREKATQELIRLGSPVRPAVREALATTQSREVRRRATEVLEKLKGASVTSLEVLRIVRGVEVLEQINTAPTRELLQSWTRGSVPAPLTAQARMSLARMR